VNVETVRYYERRGLIEQPPRPQSGFRRYAPETIARLRFIKRAQELGFSLEEIGELLALRVDPETTCAEVKERAEAKIADVEEKLQDLQKMKRALERLAESCTGSGPVSECPILEVLEAGKRK
jgi:MerR family mercuric resistance operon transcriptional regulator